MFANSVRSYARSRGTPALPSESGCLGHRDRLVRCVVTRKSATQLRLDGATRMTSTTSQLISSHKTYTDEGGLVKVPQYALAMLAHRHIPICWELLAVKSHLMEKYSEAQIVEIEFRRVFIDVRVRVRRLIDRHIHCLKVKRSITEVFKRKRNEDFPSLTNLERLKSMDGDMKNALRCLSLYLSYIEYYDLI